MNSPYAQAAMTYVRSAFASWKNASAFVGGVVGSVLFVCLLTHLGGPKELAYLKLLPFMCLFTFVTVHMKEQFADPRARLTPGFRRVHATVGGAAVLLCAVCAPAAVAWAVGWHPLGFVAVSVLLLGVVLWVVLSMSAWLLLAAVVAWVLLGIEPGKGWLLQLFVGNFEGPAVGVLLIGIVIVLVGGVQLVRLNEEMREYRWLKWNSTSRKAELVGPRPEREAMVKRLTSKLIDRQMAIVTSHARRASHSRWSQVCRWQVEMVTGLPAMLICAAPVCCFLPVMYILGNKAEGPMVALSAMTSLALPSGLVAANLWRRRSSLLSLQSLLCVDRATYLKQVGLAAALSQLQLWLCMSMVMAISWQCCERQLLPGKVAQMLSFVALCQPFFFGMSVRLLRLRSPIPVLVGYVAFFQVAELALFFLEMGPDGVAKLIVLMAAAILAVIGLALTWSAYRRWLVTDFD
jgi:hypothetical protein